MRIYIITKSGFGEHFVPVDAEPLPGLFLPHRFAVHTRFPPPSKLWIVTHVETGTAVGYGDSKEAAIKDARERLHELTPVGWHECVLDWLTEHAAAPLVSV